MRQIIRRGCACLALLVLPGCGLIDEITGPSGVDNLEVTDLTLGTGAEAVAGTIVTVYYKGWLYDKGKKGDVFDASVDGSPYSFTLGAGEVIEGWDLGLVGMRVGGVRRLVIPPDLAYGVYGAGSIPSNASLIFEVQLIKVAPVPGVKELQIVDLVVGAGAEAVSGKQLSVYYTGWMWKDGITDNKGDVFAESASDLVTFRLGVGAILSGLDKGLVGMKVGGKRRVIIPPDLAYGAEGSGVVPPFTTLILEVQLVNVND